MSLALVMYLQFIVFSDLLTLLVNRFCEPLSRLLLPSSVYFAYLHRFFLPTAGAHILASRRVSVIVRLFLDIEFIYLWV